MAEEIDPRFELARKRAKQGATAATQGQSEASQRRFASLGLGTSGAALKQEQQIMERGAQRLQGAEEGIQAAEFAEQSRKREIREGREFQTSERQASQGFAGGENALNRSFQTSERLGGQGFASGENAISRKHQAGMQTSQQDFARGERQGSQEFAAGQTETAQKIQQGQFDTSIAITQDMNEFTKTTTGQQMDLAIQQFDLDSTVTNANLVVQSLDEGYGGNTLGVGGVGIGGVGSTAPTTSSSSPSVIPYAGSGSGYVNSLGQPVNKDGSPYREPGR